MFDVMYNVGEGSHYIRESDGGDRDQEGFARRVASFATYNEAYCYIYEGWRPKPEPEIEENLRGYDGSPTGHVMIKKP